jgi:hypothetical protein
VQLTPMPDRQQTQYLQPDIVPVMSVTQSHIHESCADECEHQGVVLGKFC